MNKLCKHKGALWYPNCSSKTSVYVVLDKKINRKNRAITINLLSIRAVGSIIVKGAKSLIDCNENYTSTTLKITNNYI